ncbi:MAG: pseudouridine synthase [Spongiibacter sp.]|nr:pseudouridine synthase [Spongiibacter sp.]
MPPDETSRDFIVPPCTGAIGIHYQDSELLVIDKPSGLLSVPGRHPANQDSAISRLQEAQPEAKIVHRLDMATSGLMLIALNKDSHRALSQQFERREVDKEYIADVFGRVNADAGSIDLPLICDWPRRPLQKVCFDHGKPAQTHFRTLHRSASYSRLLLTPHTGRSHQLRVHCAALGHPILGCDFYAHPPAQHASSRLRLHASRLTFTHPTHGKVISISSPPPFANAAF